MFSSQGQVFAAASKGSQPVHLVTTKAVNPGLARPVAAAVAELPSLDSDDKGEWLGEAEYVAVATPQMRPLEAVQGMHMHSSASRGSIQEVPATGSTDALIVRPGDKAKANSLRPHVSQRSEGGKGPRARRKGGAGVVRPTPHLSGKQDGTRRPEPVHTPIRVKATPRQRWSTSTPPRRDSNASQQRPSPIVMGSMQKLGATQPKEDVSDFFPRLVGSPERQHLPRASEPRSAASSPFSVVADRMPEVAAHFRVVAEDTAARSRRSSHASSIGAAAVNSPLLKALMDTRGPSPLQHTPTRPSHLRRRSNPVRRRSNLTRTGATLREGLDGGPSMTFSERGESPLQKTSYRTLPVSHKSSTATRHHTSVFRWKEPPELEDGLQEGTTLQWLSNQQAQGDPQLAADELHTALQRAEGVLVRAISTAVKDGWGNGKQQAKPYAMGDGEEEEDEDAKADINQQAGSLMATHSFRTVGGASYSHPDRTFGTLLPEAVASPALVRAAFDTLSILATKLAAPLPALLQGVLAVLDMACHIHTKRLYGPDAMGYLDSVKASHVLSKALDNDAGMPHATVASANLELEGMCNQLVRQVDRWELTNSRLRETAHSITQAAVESEEGLVGVKATAEQLRGQVADMQEHMADMKKRLADLKEAMASLPVQLARYTAGKAAYEQQLKVLEVEFEHPLEHELASAEELLEEYRDTDKRMRDMTSGLRGHTKPQLQAKVHAYQEHHFTLCSKFNADVPRLEAAKKRLHAIKTEENRVRAALEAFDRTHTPRPDWERVLEEIPEVQAMTIMPTKADFIEDLEAVSAVRQADEDFKEAFAKQQARRDRREEATGKRHRPFRRGSLDVRPKSRVAPRPVDLEEVKAQAAAAEEKEGKEGTPAEGEEAGAEAETALVMGDVATQDLAVPEAKRMVDVLREHREQKRRVLRTAPGGKRGAVTEDGAGHATPLQLKAKASRRVLLSGTSKGTMRSSPSSPSFRGAGLDIGSGGTSFRLAGVKEVHQSEDGYYDSEEEGEGDDGWSVQSDPVHAAHEAKAQVYRLRPTAELAAELGKLVDDIVVRETLQAELVKCRAVIKEQQAELVEVNEKVEKVLAQLPEALRKQRRSSQVSARAKKKEEMANYFYGLGNGPDVPKFLRLSGKVRNRHMSKGEAEALIKQVWAEKAVYESTTKTSMRLVDYFYTFLKSQCGIQALIAEKGYNLMSALEQYVYDADIELFMLCLAGAVPDEAYYDQMDMLSALTELLESTEAAYGGRCYVEHISYGRRSYHVVGGGSGYIRKCDLMATLRSFFPQKSSADMHDIEKGLATDGVVKKGDRVAYKSLFDETEEGDQGDFAEAVRDQHLQEVQDCAVGGLPYLLALLAVRGCRDDLTGGWAAQARLQQALASCDTRDTGNVSLGDLRKSFLKMDPQLSKRRLASYVSQAVRAKVAGLSPSTQISIEQLSANLANTLLRKERSWVKEASPNILSSGWPEEPVDEAEADSAAATKKRSPKASKPKGVKQSLRRARVKASSTRRLGKRTRRKAAGGRGRIQQLG